jgi:hypothetical protein
MLTAALILVSLLAIEALNFSGFSYAERRWLSDEELIAIAANHAASFDRGSIRYASGAELLALNPGCCVVDRYDREWGEVAWRVVGWYNAVVEMNYEINLGGDAPYYDALFAISASGEIREFAGVESPSPM